MMSGDGSPSSRDEVHREEVDMDDESNNEVHSSRCQGSTSNPSGNTNQIIFDEYGRPVDVGSEQFSSTIGKITRAHCRPAIGSWKRVPQGIKDDIWRSVVGKYAVPEIYKAKILKYANTSWKNWKCSLRRACDKHNTVAERKRNMPNKIIVKKEDWEDFVDFCSTNEDKMRREAGKKARENIKVQHTTGRTGCARIAHRMKKESPTGEVNRTELYLATHISKSSDPESSIVSNENIDKIRRLIEDDPYLGQKDLDNDPVAMVYGRDQKGFVRGMGGGVSKTEIHASAASREIARQQIQKNKAMETDISTLKEQVATLMQKANAMSSSRSTSELRNTSQAPDQSIFPRTCFLKDFKRKHVAFGRLNIDAPPNEDVYNIIIDEVFDKDADLFDGDGKLGDMVGDVINWPKVFVQLIRV